MKKMKSKIAFLLSLISILYSCETIDKELKPERDNPFDSESSSYIDLEKNKVSIKWFKRNDTIILRFDATKVLVGEDAKLFLTPFNEQIQYDGSYYDINYSDVYYSDLVDKVLFGSSMGIHESGFGTTSIDGFITYTYRGDWKMEFTKQKPIIEMPLLEISKKQYDLYISYKSKSYEYGTSFAQELFSIQFPESYFATYIDSIKHESYSSVKLYYNTKSLNWMQNEQFYLHFIQGNNNQIIIPKNKQGNVVINEPVDTFLISNNSQNNNLNFSLKIFDTIAIEPIFKLKQLTNNGFRPSLEISYNPSQLPKTDSVKFQLNNYETKYYQYSELSKTNKIELSGFLLTKDVYDKRISGNNKSYSWTLADLKLDGRDYETKMSKLSCPGSYMLAGFSCKGFGYMIYKNSDNTFSLYKYTPLSDSWEKILNPSFPVGFYAGNYWNDLKYTFISTSNYVLAMHNSDNSKHYLFDGSNWTSVADFPSTYYGFWFVVKDIPYIQEENSTSSPSSIVYKYVKSTNNWERIADLPEPRSNVNSAFALKDTGYIYGGYGSKTFYSMLKYNPDDNKWSTVLKYLTYSGSPGEIITDNNGLALILGNTTGTIEYTFDGSNLYKKIGSTIISFYTLMRYPTKFEIGSDFYYLNTVSPTPEDFYYDVYKTNFR